MRTLATTKVVKPLPKKEAAFRVDTPKQLEKKEKESDERFLKAYQEFQITREIYHITCTLPNPPENYKEIANYGKSIDDCTFPYPDNKMLLSINEVYRNPEIDIENIEANLTDEQIAFINNEMLYIRDGRFFYNKDRLEYVTGEHYFFLSYWKIPVINEYDLIETNNPNFVDSNRDHFYFWEEVVKSRFCFGIIESFRRRDGKTHRANSRVYRGTVRGEKRHSGIQSKTGDDSIEVMEKLVASWQELPEFLKPIDSGNSNPKMGIYFDQPKQMGNAKARVYKTVLKSKITRKNTKEKAYDGTQLYRYLMDESGKWEEASAYKTWHVVREAQAVGATIIGKAILTSTVEEMTKGGGKQFKMLWDESDPREVSPRTRRTVSGLWRYFSPSDYGFVGDEIDADGNIIKFVDKWGYSNREAAKEYIMAERAIRKGEALLSYMRKYPLEESDMWVMPSQGNNFALHKILQQMNYNRDVLMVQPERGNFYWLERFRRVAWAADPNGRWLASWIPKEQNKVVISNNRIIPTNHIVKAGCDPIDTGMDVVDKARASNAASYVFRKRDVVNPLGSNAFVCEYIARRETPEMFYEDMAMQCIFYGCQMLVESNRIGLINWFFNNGLDELLCNRPPELQTDWTKRFAMENKKGIPTNSKDVRERLEQYTQTYIYENIGENEETGNYGNCVFDRLLDDWYNFDPNNWTPHDSFVAASLALAAADMPVYKRREVKESDLAYRYKN